jgi:hypothetical protein
VTADWIDRLIDSIDAFNAAPQGSPLTVGEVTSVMRDWLLGYGEIGTTAPQGLAQSEQQTLAGHFAVTSLSEPINAVVDLETKLRGLCGMLLESPQFQLAGIAETALGPKPRLRVCNRPPCTYREMCGELAPAIQSQLPKDVIFRCGEDDVDVFPLPGPDDIPHKLPELCPPPLCGLLKGMARPGCDPLGAEVDIKACPKTPPACDPRCSGIQCCGGAAPVKYRSGDLLVAWADGATVRAAERVQILRRGASRYETLREGRRVAIGDILALPGGSIFDMRTREGETLRTPREGLPLDAEAPTILMMISGEDALRSRHPDIPPPAQPLPLDHIRRIRNSPLWQRGEGGMMLTEKQRREFRYSENEIAASRARQRELQRLR